jgi:hypothetical protein
LRIQPTHTQANVLLGQYVTMQALHVVPETLSTNHLLRNIHVLTFTRVHYVTNYHNFSDVTSLLDFVMCLHPFWLLLQLIVVYLSITANITEDRILSDQQ